MNRAPAQVTVCAWTQRPSKPKPKPFVRLCPARTPRSCPGADLVQRAHRRLVRPLRTPHSVAHTPAARAYSSDTHDQFQCSATPWYGLEPSGSMITILLYTTRRGGAPQEVIVRFISGKAQFAVIVRCTADAVQHTAVWRVNRLKVAIIILYYYGVAPRRV